ncbi:MAG TPA: hypothetical protein VNE00_25065 [Paraburkholderia sp.]|nr:hypothetical protein [Paraburkholderia sp.]
MEDDSTVTAKKIREQFSARHTDAMYGAAPQSFRTYAGWRIAYAMKCASTAHLLFRS